MNNDNELNELNPPVMDGYTKIPTFKLWVANRFPYMETDFDGITNYELLEALTNYLNNVIKNEENVESNVAKLNQAYLELFNYVKDYFNNLDVQEEINNKLDDLVADGTLTRLIGEYVQPLIDEQNQEISEFKSGVNAQIAQQNAQIQAVESGSPLVASSVSQMTDTTRVYVNTSDGNWYYYNGSQWTIGGVYQSTAIAENSVGYKELKDDLKSFITPVQIERGSINEQGQEINATASYRTNTFEVHKGDKFNLPIDMQYRAYYYDVNTNAFIEAQPFQRVQLTFGGNYLIRLVFRKNSSYASFTNEDLELIYNTAILNGKNFINTLNENKIGNSVIEYSNLDKTTKDGIKNSYLKNGLSFKDTPLFINGTLNNTNGSYVATIEYANKVSYDFLENEKVQFILKQGYQCKIAYYNDNGTFISSSSYTKAQNEDVNVEYTISNKGKLVLATIATSSTLVDVNEMIEDFTHLPLTTTTQKDRYINNNFIHFSFDDVTTCLTNLNNNKATYTSLFDEPFFNYLKSLHDTYGAKFSLYVWNNEVLGQIGNQFKQDFIDNNDWLKIGYHAYSSTTGDDMSTLTTEQALEYYNQFISYALVMAGLNSIDRIPRLNMFKATSQQVEALRDTKCGIYGLLTPDDNRNVGYLNTNQHNYLLNNCNLFDTSKGLIYYATNMRLDWFVSGFSSQYDYNVPTESNPYDELVTRYSNPDYANLNNNLIVFTHEWQLYTSSHTFNNTMKSYIEDVCRFANEYGYVFDYIQNRVQNIKSLIIN